MTSTVGAVIVHHRRFPAVLTTVDAVVEAGVRPEHVVVVDNSEDVETERGLREAASGWHVHVVDNRGYGAAVNAGAALLGEVDLALVATHEVVLDRDSLRRLVDAIASDPLVAAAGPGTVLTDGRVVWSHGGVLTRWLRLPRQLVRRPTAPASVRDVDWLDGSCVLYRRDLLQRNAFREEFFLYFEETEFHARLRELGHRVVAVDGASAYQSSSGMPPYWGSRNVVLFQWAHGTPLSRVVAPPWFTLRMMAISLLGRDWRGVVAAPRGLVAGYRAVASSR